MPDRELSLRTRLTAIAAVFSIFAGIGLYVHELPFFNNTIDVQKMVTGSFVLGAVGAGLLLYGLRNRITPLDRHVPEILFISLVFILFSPLLVSLLNRGLGRKEEASFEFLNEAPFASTGGYGFLRTQQIKISGYQLDVREAGRLLRFRYKKQAYFPLTKPGESVLVPVRKGLFGFRVVVLE
jgi:hypothetical protein